MKKVILLVLVFIVTLSNFVLVSCRLNNQNKNDGVDSQIKESEGLKFELNDDESSYIVMGIGTCTDTDIVIPSTYQGLPVTGIANSAFSQCESITSVIIPDSITSVGNGSFAFCYSLKSVSIGNSVTEIQLNTFEGCNSLTNINIPRSVKKISAFAFFACKSLLVINFDGTVEEWNGINKSSLWNDSASVIEVICSDGTVSVK